MDINELINTYERRSYTTYNCRLEAYERLKRENSSWNIGIFSLSFLTICASLILISPASFSKQQSEIQNFNLFILGFSILNLLLSLSVVILKYPDKISTMEKSYKKFQKISCDLEYLQNSEYPPEKLNGEFQRLKEKYHLTIDESTNHTKKDYKNYCRGKAGFLKKIIRFLSYQIDRYPIIMAIVIICLMFEFTI